MIQTRSEQTGVREFPTMAQAMAHATKDTTVWKISFLVGEEGEKEAIRLVRHKLPIGNGERASIWVYEPM